jgi:CheY-like chemotaxis protein
MILDLRMADPAGRIPSGIALLARIRAESSLRSLPVIVLTGHLLAPDEEASVRRHGATILYKPTALYALKRYLLALTGRSRRGIAESS